MNQHDLYEQIQKEFDPLFKQEEGKQSSESSTRDDKSKREPYIFSTISVKL